MPENPAVGEQGVTKCVTIDADLQKIIDRWDSLPDHLRKTITTLIDATKPE